MCSVNFTFQQTNACFFYLLANTRRLKSASEELGKMNSGVLSHPSLSNTNQKDKSAGSPSSLIASQLGG